MRRTIISITGVAILTTLLTNDPPGADLYTGGAFVLGALYILLLVTIDKSGNKP